MANVPRLGANAWGGAFYALAAWPIVRFRPQQCGIHLKASGRIPRTIYPYILSQELFCNSYQTLRER